MLDVESSPAVLDDDDETPGGGRGKRVQKIKQQGEIATRACMNI